jgi:TetR/AcrR family transcriptional repressor of nem operon
MRRSQEDKAKSRQRIVEVAATRVREAGTETPGVAEIMHGAGMTHGGFYKHFESRDDLVATAVEAAMHEGIGKISEVIAAAEDPLAAFVDWYVSDEHVADPGHGCVVAALTGDIARSDERLRGAYGEQVERYLAILEKLLGTRERATVALATMVGAVTVARAVDTPALSEEILRDVRAALGGHATRSRT